MADCIFCRIIEGTIPSRKVYEDEYILAFEDIDPAAPVHVLVVPKKHIESLEAVNPENVEYVVKAHFAIQQVTKAKKINAGGYRVIVNTGKDGGQTVPHLHYHVLGGTVFTEKII